MQDKVSTETIRICSIRPEKVCSGNVARDLGPQQSTKRCKTFYESGKVTHSVEKKKIPLTNILFDESNALVTSLIKTKALS